MAELARVGDLRLEDPVYALLKDNTIRTINVERLEISQGTNLGLYVNGHMAGKDKYEFSSRDGITYYVHYEHALAVQIRGIESKIKANEAKIEELIIMIGKDKVQLSALKGITTLKEGR